MDKRGAKSDEAYAREVLGEMANARKSYGDQRRGASCLARAAEGRHKGISRDEVEEATQWIGGLDRIHKTRGILACFDFTATPFAPTGKKSGEETLFGWIVSDFGLNDAIESGLVKTPRVVIRDDGRLGKDYKSRLYHIYNDVEVRDDFNRKAQEHQPLPDLVNNAYTCLARIGWRR